MIGDRRKVKTGWAGTEKQCIGFIERIRVCTGTVLVTEEGEEKQSGGKLVNSSSENVWKRRDRPKQRARITLTSGQREQLW